MGTANGLKRYHGKNAAVYWAGYNLRGYSNQFSIGVTIKDSEASGFGEDADHFEQGTYNWNSSLTMFGQGNGSTGLFDKLFSLIQSGAYPFFGYPQGVASTNHYLYGLAMMSGIPLQVSRNDNVGLQLSLKGANDLFNYATA